MAETVHHTKSLHLPWPLSEGIEAKSVRRFLPSAGNPLILTSPMTHHSPLSLLIPRHYPQKEMANR
jgi:hypothetical protein